VLIVFGLGLATRTLAGESRLLLTVLPAAVAATGIAAALVIARRPTAMPNAYRPSTQRSRTR
jgi:hypothetical protein